MALCQHWKHNQETLTPLVFKKKQISGTVPSSSVEEQQVQLQHGCYTGAAHASTFQVEQKPLGK